MIALDLCQNLVDNLSEGFHNDRCIDCKSFLDYMTTKDEKLIFRCFSCKKNYKKDFNKELIKRFANTYSFCNKDLNKFILLLRQGVYPYEYMDNWERFNNLLLPNKDAFYSNLNVEDINGRMVLMLLMVEEGIRGGMCHVVHRYAKVNNKYMKNYDEKKESSYTQYLDANNLYGWAMSQKLPVSGFKWKKNMPKFTEEFIKNYDEDSGKGYILEVDVEYPKNLHDLHSDLPFLPERTKINKCSKLVYNLYDKNNYVAHIRSLKQTLNHGLILKKFHKVIQFSKEAWLKQYIDMNTELR